MLPMETYPLETIQAAAGRRAALSALVLIVLGLLGPGTAASDPEPEGEAHLKVEMIYNIAKFIRWPTSTFDASGGQMIFAVVGEDSLAAILVSTLSQRSINGRHVFVRLIRRAQDMAGCHVLFISTSAEHRVAELLATAQHQALLTVGDSPGFVAAGGMVDFVREDNRLRFQIAPGRAEQAGLKVSAKLLALARVVEPAPYGRAE